MDTKRINKTNKFDIAFVFLVAFIPRLYYCIQMVPVRSVGDEVATIATGAYFAGLDWSAIMSDANYYGGGFSILLAPIFAITDNPFIIYRAAIILTAILQSMVAPISYHLMDKYFNIKNRAFLLISAIACSFMVVTRSNIVYNEHMLILLVWLVAWLLCILVHCKDNKKKALYSFLLILCLSYALTVHIRAYTLWIAVALTIIYYFIISKKCLTSIPVLVVGALLGIFASNFFINTIQTNIWMVGDDEILTNSVIQISTQADLTDLTVWKTWLNIILGQIYTIGIYSGTILLSSLIIFLPIIFGVIFSKNKRGELENCLYAIIPLTFMLCIAMTIAAQSISWLSNATTAMQGGNDYGFKAFTYIRYFGPYCGPVFMTTLVYIYSHYKNTKKIMWGSIFLFLILQAYWTFSIAPLLDGVTVTSEIFVEFVGGIYSKYKDILMYLVPFCILLCIFLAVMFLFRKKAPTVAVGILCIFLVWEYGSGSTAMDIPSAKSTSEMVMSGYNLIKNIEKNGEKISDTIYAIDDRSWDSVRGRRTYYLYQFYLNRYMIIPDYPKEDCEEAIVFCNEKNDELCNRGYSCYKLDSNEFVYVLGENYIKVVESALNK